VFRVLRLAQIAHEFILKFGVRRVTLGAFDGSQLVGMMSGSTLAFTRHAYGLMTEEGQRQRGRNDQVRHD